MEDGQKENNPSIRGQMIKGSAWMIAMRWCIRGIGLISTIILARLLDPEDFGIVAMGALIVGLLGVLSNFGVDLALIRKTDATRIDYDTAWTFKVLQGTLISILILALSPFAADYFNEERVVPVIQVLAVAVFFNGLENIGVVAFRKELDFAREFKFSVLKKLAVFFTTISLAFYIANYWALVTGIVVGQVVGVIISYKMHPYRPKFCLKASAELWSFSQWMLLTSIANFGHLKITDFIIGGVKDTSQLGSYNVATDISLMPGSEFIVPISRALLPGYAKLQSEPRRLGEAYLNVLGMVAIIAFSTSMGLMVIAEDFTWVILGRKWTNVIPIIEWLAICSIPLAFASLSNNILIAIGKIRLSAILSWGYFVLLAPAIYFAAHNGTLVDIAAVRTVLFFGFGVTFILLVKISLPITLKEIFRVMWRPIVASVIMVVVMRQLHIQSIDYHIVTILIDISVGAITFILVLGILWFLSGRPRSSEHTIVEYGKKVLTKFNR